MSTRKIKGNLPDVQERLLLTLYALHQKHALDYCVSGNPADYDGKPYFLGSAISLVLGGGVVALSPQPNGGTFQKWVGSNLHSHW